MKDWIEAIKQRLPDQATVDKLREEWLIKQQQSSSINVDTMSLNSSDDNRSRSSSLAPDSADTEGKKSERRKSGGSVIMRLKQTLKKGVKLSPNRLSTLSTAADDSSADESGPEDSPAKRSSTVPTFAPAAIEIRPKKHEEMELIETKQFDKSLSELLGTETMVTPVLLQQVDDSTQSLPILNTLDVDEVKKPVVKPAVAAVPSQQESASRHAASHTVPSSRLSKETPPTPTRSTEDTTSSPVQTNSLNIFALIVLIMALAVVELSQLWPAFSRSLPY